MKSDNLSPVRGPAPAWTADPLHVEGDDEASPVNLTDAERLRLLATWFDHFDDWREATRKIAPGIDQYREVQRDLRRIAGYIGPWRVPAGWLVVAALLGLAAGLLVPR